MGTGIRVIDLFAGCGGLTAGLVSTGEFDPVAAVEMDLHAAATYAHNFGDHVFVGDIADWINGSMPAAEVVVGGPPCQGFSALGKQDPDDPRNLMWRHYMEVLRRVRPAFFILENVPQFLRSQQFHDLVAEATPGGTLAAYRVEAFVLNAAEYGVPQRRRRAVLVGRPARMKELGPPEPGEEYTLGDALPSWATAEVSDVRLPERHVEILGARLPGPFKLRQLHVTREPTPLSMARFRAIPPGGNRTNLPWELQAPCWQRHKSGAGDVMGRLSFDKPAVTIRTEFYKPEKGRYLHPEAHRPITHAEAAIIQGFDEHFEWLGTKVSIARQIGNAVPPPLAAAIGSHIAKHL